MVESEKGISYQKLSAIFHFISHDFDTFRYESKNFEDFVLFRNTPYKEIVIGESKNELKNKWTLRSLFYKGTEIGPILQLWNRCQAIENCKPIMYLSSPIDDKFIDIVETTKFAMNKVKNKDLEDIINRAKTKLETKTGNKIKHLEELNLPNIKDFLIDLSYYHFSEEELETRITQSLNIKIKSLGSYKDFLSGRGYKIGEEISKNYFYLRIYDYSEKPETPELRVMKGIYEDKLRTKEVRCLVVQNISKYNAYDIEVIDIKVIQEGEIDIEENIKRRFNVPVLLPSEIRYVDDSHGRSNRIEGLIIKYKNKTGEIFTSNLFDESYNIPISLY